MLRPLLALSLMTAAPAVAQTADQEARFVDAITAVEARSIAFYGAVDPRFVPLLTPSEDAPTFEENRDCFLARIETDGGAQMLEDYIAAMEVVGATEITSLVELGASLPEVLTDELVFAASAECGPLSYSTAQMVTPEFTALMDEPEIMQGLMGQ